MFVMETICARSNVCDALLQDFVPRYGRHKVQIDKEKTWVMEVPRQSDIFEDQFKKAASAKKERVAKNEYQRLRNIARDRKDAVPGVGVMRTDTRDVGQVSTGTAGQRCCWWLCWLEIYIYKLYDRSL